MNKSAPYLDGWHAHLAGTSSDDNPYNERSQAYSHAQWTSGWCERFEAVKRGRSLELDET